MFKVFVGWARAALKGSGELSGLKRLGWMFLGTLGLMAVVVLGLLLGAKPILALLLYRASPSPPEAAEVRDLDALAREVEAGLTQGVTREGLVLTVYPKAPPRAGVPSFASLGHPAPTTEGRVTVDVFEPDRDGARLPGGGGFQGLAVDKGLDGVRLRRAQGQPFHFLPGWAITRGLKGRELLKAARAAAVASGWSKADAEAADAYPFRTRSFLWEAGRLVPLVRGRPVLGELTAALLLARVRLAAEYLKRETGKDGQLTYEYDALQDQVLSGSNLLRHAGTVYAMAQALAVVDDPALAEAARRGAAAFERALKIDPAHPDERFALEGRQAKLGGAGLGVCMYVELAKRAADARALPLARALGRHLLRMQGEDGAFQSFYDWDGRGAPGEQSHFYPGEAILGLVKLYQATGERPWLDAARRGADYLIERRWEALGLRLVVPPDAWLVQALALLDEIEPSEAYTRYALEIIEVMARQRLLSEDVPAGLYGGGLETLALPNVASSGSKLEAFGAAIALERRRPQWVSRPGLALSAAKATARYVLTTQFAEGADYFLPNPERARGGFPYAPDVPVIRNDYVQHNLSGLILLLSAGEIP